MTDEIVVHADGAVEMVLDLEAGKVLQHFREPMQRILYEPTNALDVAAKLAELAYEARGDLKPAGSALKADLVERHRMTLTHRIALILRTARGDTRMSDGQLAQAVVETCLKEVF
jgi:hypothetical protein